MGADGNIGNLEKKKERYNERFNPKRYDTSKHIKGIDDAILQQKKYYEQDAALCYLFHHLSDELWRIECKIQQNFNKLDERITHIEKFLTDDIKKEDFLENI